MHAKEQQEQQKQDFKDVEARAEMYKNSAAKSRNLFLPL